MMSGKVYTIFNYSEKEKKRVVCGKGKTQQHFKDSCDINKMIKKYKKTGLMRQRDPKKMKFGDFSDVPSYAEVRNRMLNIERKFMQYSAEIRARFNNDCSKFVEFMQDNKNFDEAVKLGIVHRDMSSIRYFDNNGVDITEKVKKERGMFDKGKKVEEEKKDEK